MSDGLESLKQAELKLQSELAETNIDDLVLSPESVVSIAKIVDQQQQLEHELVTNDEFQEAVSSVLRQDAQVVDIFQDIDFSTIDTSAIESITTDEFVVELTESAEGELTDEIDVSDGITDEEAQEVIRWAGIITAAATARDSAPSLGEDETVILTFIIFVTILFCMGYSGVAPIVGGNALAELLGRILSARGLWDEED